MIPEEIENHIVYRMVKAVQTEEAANHLLEILIADYASGRGVTREEAERTVRINIGYFGGYCDHDTRARIERLFKVEHPYFGSIAQNGPPTPEQAFQIGYALGMKYGNKND